MDWYDVYLEQINKSGGNNEYMDFKIKHKKKLIKELIKHSGNGKLIEAGCGTGIITSHMAHLGYEVTGIDINDKILKLAKKLEKGYYGENKATYTNMSIFDIKYKENEFDLCFSVGVLEHFDDDLIISSIKQQVNIAKKVIIVIPTKWFDDDETLHGDDRFLTLKKWRELIKSGNGKVIAESSYPFKQKTYHKIKNIRKIFRPKAYRIFVVEKAS